MAILLLATLDTKGVEAAFVRDRLLELGLPVRVVDTGCLGEAAFVGDVPREQVMRAAGVSLDELRQANDRGEAVKQAATGAARIVAEAYARGEVEGVIAIGGSAGTTIGTTAMRALPIGVPKLMVSTLASGNVRSWVGDKDIAMLNAVVDIAGLNRISRQILGEAAAAMAGMVKFRTQKHDSGDKPLIAATMFGVTTPCVQQARAFLEAAGYEVLVFHATGNGGQAMESLIDEGLIAGVLDITTTELADELVGGVLSAGPDRLTAAGRRGIPQVISVGALDMVNFGGYASGAELPDGAKEQFRGRKFYKHNPAVTLMRTTPEENARLGAEIARKAAAATGPTAILLPLRGVSAIDADGKPFEDRDARAALFDAIRRNAANVEVLELDNHINDPPFAEAAAQKLLALIRQAARSN